MTAPRLLPWTALAAAIGETRLEEVRADLEARGTDDLDRDAFLLNGVVAGLLRELIPEDAPSEAVMAYGALLHTLCVCWARGWPVTTIDDATLRVALSGTPPLSSLTRLPPLVTYLQLPPRLVWAEPAPGASHEPLDGLFVIARVNHLRTLAVLGLREGREGLTTMEGDLALPAPPPGPRPNGSAPFSSLLPAGERAHLLSVVDTHELAALALLALVSAVPREHASGQKPFQGES